MNMEEVWRGLMLVAVRHIFAPQCLLLVTEVLCLMALCLQLQTGWDLSLEWQLVV